MIELFDPLTGPNTDKSGSGSNANEAGLSNPKTLRLEPHYLMQSVSYLGHSLGGSFTPPQRCSWSILQPQSTR